MFVEIPLCNTCDKKQAGFPVGYFEVTSESGLSCGTCPLDRVLRRKWCFEAINRALCRVSADAVMHLAAQSPSTASRLIIAWKLCTIMKVEDVADTLLRGAPLHPQTQGKIERRQQTLGRILLEDYYMPR